MKEMQEDGRFCRAYLRTMDAERAAAEIGRKDGYAMLAKRTTQQKLERMRCAAADQLKREDVLRQLARLAFGRVDDAVQLALRRGELDTGGLELSAVSELRVSEKGIEVKLVDRVRALEALWKLLDTGEPQGSDPLYQALTALGQEQETAYGDRDAPLFPQPAAGVDMVADGPLAGVDLRWRCSQRQDVLHGIVFLFMGAARF